MATARPRVRIIATGGSISGLGPHRLDYLLYSELGRRLAIEQMLARIPEVHEIADVQGENLTSVGSTSIGPQEWLQIAQRINQIFQDEPEVSGIVVTHGTATLEETAYFLHLTVKSVKPVVVTGAMRPPTAVSTDADLNLLDAIRIAACPDAGGRGVLTVLNNEIQSARDVTKSNTLRVETFHSHHLGLLGYADSDGQVLFYRSVTRKHTVDTPFNVVSIQTLPRVDIVYAYGGADGLLVDAVCQHRSAGLVVAGFGSGTFPPVFLDAAVRAAADGVPVVLASRSTSGRIIMTPKKKEAGFIVADDLHPQKARILLMLALTMSHDRQVIQEAFYTF
ncbi:MAG: asparaginase [Candidatus Entotheonellia bacterium]